MEIVAVNESDIKFVLVEPLHKVESCEAAAYDNYFFFLHNDLTIFYKFQQPGSSKVYIL